MEKKKTAGLLEALIAVQKANGLNYIDGKSLEDVAEQFDLTVNQVKDTATFYKDLALAPRGRHIIRLCSSPCCWLQGGREIAEAVKAFLGVEGGQTTADGRFTLEYTGCIGACGESPAMLLDDRVVGNLTAEKVIETLQSCRDDTVGRDASREKKVSGEKKDPDADGGGTVDFAGLKRALEMEPDQIIEAVKASGLRGRGGAYFPAGIKMNTVACQLSDEKYVVCNADEGEPGTFKDRYLLEHKPLRVLEGMIAAGRAVGAARGFLYLRGEYTDLRPRLERVIGNLRKEGLLGKNIMGSEFTFDIEVRSGAGAYVCGEESALLSSLEGLRGLTRVKPPIPAISGLWGCPTLIDNVETFACMAHLLADGLYEDGPSADTRLVCLSGAFRKKGVFEVPLGIPVKQLIEEVGGGAEDGKEISFLQFGGLSGALCRTDDVEGINYDVENLRAAGLSMGTGAIFAGSEKIDVVEYIRGAAEFYREESCGRCVPCREGLKQLCSELEVLADGEKNRTDEQTEVGTEKALQRIQRLLNLLSVSASCGLGQAVPAVVGSGLKLLGKGGGEI